MEQSLRLVSGAWSQAGDELEPKNIINDGFRGKCRLQFVLEVLKVDDIL